MAYLTLTEFKAMARLPASYVDEVEATAPGFTALQLDLESAHIDSKLSKRYAVPFDPVSKAPLIVKRWLVDLVSVQLWLRRGLDGTQLDAQVYIDAAEQARKDLLDAADAKDGLIELPLRSDALTTSGISKPRLRSYSETSPFVGQRIQRQRGREEDANGTGTKH